MNFVKVSLGQNNRSYSCQKVSCHFILMIPNMNNDMKYDESVLI